MPGKTVSSHGSATGCFELYPLRFRFATCKLREFSPNIIRGAFGSALRRIDPDSYRRWFVPVAGGPSGLANPPRPFVFRLPGPLEIGLNLFLTRQPAVELFTRVMEELGTIESVDGTGVLQLPLAASCGPVSRIRVRFMTPTELKGAERPEFGVLMARIRDRISTLRALYGAGPLGIDFKAFGERAGRVAMSRCELVQVAAERVSRGSGQRHSIGGFMGVVEYGVEYDVKYDVEYGKDEYEGELAEFLPYLEIARWTGVGRQTVWGKGEIAYEAF